MHLQLKYSEAGFCGILPQPPEENPVWFSVLFVSFNTEAHMTAATCTESQPIAWTRELQRVRSPCPPFPPFYVTS